MALNLKPRLQSVAEQVPKGAPVADIGTDHAYLPVWLILNGVSDRAIAADVRPGPLARARETARRYGVAERMSFRLCDGLSGIRRSEAEAIVIAGMGGDTIAGILAAAPWAGEKTLLLQPMTRQPELRRWLSERGYAIRRERISREGDRLYSSWTVTAGAMGPLSPGALWAGAQSDDPLRGAYLDHVAEKARKSLAGHVAAARPDERAIQELELVLEDLRTMKGEWLACR